MADAETANEQLVRDFFAKLSTGNLDLLRPLLHPDATWKPMGKNIPGAGEHKGHKGILDEFLGSVRGLFVDGDPKVEIDTLFSKGDLVAAETRAKGKFRTGKDYDNSYCWVIRIRDGKVFSLHEYMDTAYIQSVTS